MNRIAARLIRKPLRVYGLVARSMTLGVRLAGFDEVGHVFLARHTYRPGWYLPGGGVDPGETAEAAMRREAREEGRLVLRDPPILHAIFYNRREGRDHVLLYVCRNVTQAEPKQPDREIAETGFFAPGALPDGTTPATRRRLAEIAGNAPPQADW